VAFALPLKSDISQDETSEEFIGEWAEKRGIRDQLVIATKASPTFLRVARLQIGCADVIISTQTILSEARTNTPTR
jgi:aryl-alcohol dehydrogenase-like predicted oxidoreductase